MESGRGLQSLEHMGTLSVSSETRSQERHRKETTKGFNFYCGINLHVLMLKYHKKIAESLGMKFVYIWTAAM